MCVKKCYYGLVIGLISLAFFAQTIQVNAQGKKEHLRIAVSPSNAQIIMGETLQFLARVTDKNGTEKDTTVNWSVTRTDIGTVNETGLFTALEAGNAQVVATVGRTSGKANVKVVSDSSKQLYRIIVTPSDTVLAVGESVQMRAQMVDTLGNVQDVAFTWSVTDSTIGQIDSSAVFTAQAKGQAFVYAKSGGLRGKAHVVVLKEKSLRNLGYSIAVTPGDTTVEVGTRIQYTAALYDSNGVRIDSALTWSVSSDGFGEISEDGLFTALARGQGFVYATIENLSGKSHVNVKDSTARRVEGWHLVISPQDTVVMVGDQVAYSVLLMDTLGNTIDTTADFDRRGRDVGYFENNVFTTTDKGIGLIKARLGNYNATTRIIVTADGEYATGDSATIQFRNWDGKQEGALKRLSDKDVLKITNLPFPLNILNGGELIFQPGCLNDSVRISITLTSAADITTADSTVNFEGEILNGISFHVYVNDTLVSPYYFDPPVGLVLPYKEELMQELGLDPEDLWLFFYSDSSGLDSAGITNIVVDSASNKIYAEIHHFSDIVIAPSAASGITDTGDAQTQPDAFILYGNYPNPFNPETRIRFTVPSSSPGRVSITIYNIMGKAVKTLADREYAAGTYTLTWQGDDEFNRKVSSGVYICRLKSGSVTKSSRMILLK